MAKDVALDNARRGDKVENDEAQNEGRWMVLGGRGPGTGDQRFLSFSLFTYNAHILSTSCNSDQSIASRLERRQELGQCIALRLQDLLPLLLLLLLDGRAGSF